MPVEWSPDDCEQENNQGQSLIFCVAGLELYLSFSFQSIVWGFFVTGITGYKWLGDKTFELSNKSSPLCLGHRTSLIQ